MSKIVFLFPGQASQSVGMDSFLRYFPEAREILEKTDSLSNIESLSRIIAEGPADLLTRTDNVQPAITIISLAALAVLEKAGIKPNGTAGHSLGEYSALVAAEVITIEDAVRLVCDRGRLMQDCADRFPGGMVALIGISLEDAGKITEQAADLGPVGIANMNSEGQVVISGAKEPLEKASSLASEMGARRVIPLRVSGAWHSPLMKDAAEGLLHSLEGTDFRDPSIPVVANVTADYIRSGEESRELLRKQVTSPVLWADSIKRLILDGFDTFVEVGPGAVLQGMLRRNREITVYGTDTKEKLDKTINKFRQI